MSPTQTAEALWRWNFLQEDHVALSQHSASVHKATDGRCSKGSVEAHTSAPQHKAHRLTCSSILCSADPGGGKWQTVIIGYYLSYFVIPVASYLTIWELIHLALGFL